MHMIHRNSAPLFAVVHYHWRVLMDAGVTAA
jgi:hypothetical protein